MRKLERIYHALNSHYGDLFWWPAETPFEVIVGAVLTQNTAWTNVEKAIRRFEGKLSPERVLSLCRGASGDHPPRRLFQAEGSVPESRHRMVYQL